MPSKEELDRVAEDLGWYNPMVEAIVEQLGNRISPKMLKNKKVLIESIRVSQHASNPVRVSIDLILV